MLDAVGEWIIAKVDRHATLLKGVELVDFLEAQGSLRLEFSFGRKLFQSSLKQGNPESNQEHISTQLSLNFGKEGQALPEIPNSHSKLDKDLAPQKPIGKLKRGESQSKDTLADRFQKVVHGKNVLKDKDRGEASGKNVLKEKKKKETSKPIEPKNDSAEKLPSIPTGQPERTLTPTAGQSLVKVVFHTAEDVKI